MFTFLLKYASSVESLKNKHAELAVDEYLFEQIGRKYGFGKTKAGELYYLGKDVNDLETLLKLKIFLKFQIELDIAPDENMKSFYERVSEKGGSARKKYKIKIKK